MKNLRSKIINYLEKENHINPNNCQIKAAKKIDLVFQESFKKDFFSFLKKKKNIYIHGSIGVGKSLILKAINKIFYKSAMFHFTDLIFYLQKKDLRFFDSKKIILIDEFYINNFTNLILFKNFLEKSIKENKLIIMSGNKNLNNIYHDPINLKVCKQIIDLLNKSFIKIKMMSKIDYRTNDPINKKFFFIQDLKYNKKQNLLRKNLSSSTKSQTISFKRLGNNFKLEKIYGNVLDIFFTTFFKKNLVFQDYELLSKKIKIIIVRDIPKMDEDSKNLIARFISFVDAMYENKNILSLSTRVQLNDIYVGKTNLMEFKRTISRIREMGSSNYIKNNLGAFEKQIK